MPRLIAAADGQKWALRATGPAGAPSLVLLHGFTGHGGFWDPLAAQWSGAWRVLAPDLPGHGGSPAPGPGSSLARAADSLADVLKAEGATPAVLLGYSLGGRLALHLALAHPELVRALVLVGAAPGLAHEAERAERRAADARWAALLRERGLEAFLAAWEAQPLFASQAALDPEQQAFMRAMRAGQDAEALAAALEAFGLGAQADLSPALPQLQVPTTLVAGALDAKFTALAAAMAARLPDATPIVVPECGHNVPLERPEALLGLVASPEFAIS